MPMPIQETSAFPVVVDFQSRCGYNPSESRTFPDLLTLIKELPALTKQARTRRRNLCIHVLSPEGLRREATRFEFLPKRR